jgi:hypothetical protein
MTHKELCFTYKLPHKWVRSHVKRYESTEAALAAFEHPDLSDCVSKRISRRRSQGEVTDHIHTTYNVGLIDLIQRWADLGYRLTRIAFWLDIHPANLRDMVFKTGHKIHWLDNPALDNRGQLMRYRVNDTPTTLTAFATRYNYQVGALSDKWRDLTDEQMSNEMTRIAKAADLVQGFLRGQ